MMGFIYRYFVEFGGLAGRAEAWASGFPATAYRGASRLGHEHSRLQSLPAPIQQSTGIPSLLFPEEEIEGAAGADGVE